ncbi:MAG: alkaline phosphatase family protein [Hyphomicrobiales bacterium]
MRSPERKKVIFVLIDALGAVYFSAHRSRLPYLSQLAEQGISVARVTPAIPGTSRPGRSTILTGSDTSVNGVYGNSVLDDKMFRPATESDINGKTIAGAAHDAGLDVVGLGFGLVRPEDTTLQVDAWWEHLKYPGLTNIKVPSSQDIWKVRRDPERRLSRFLDAELGSGQKSWSDAGLHPYMVGLASDQLMLQLAADLACSDQPPDLILTEFSTTDLVQHYHGYDSPTTNWAYQTADMAIGLLLHRLTAGKRIDDYVVVVASDHGQAPIHTAIYPEPLIPHDRWTTEGASLHVVMRSVDEAAGIGERLSELGVKQLEGRHLPASARAEGVVTFVAPKGMGFERRPEGSLEQDTTGVPTIVSTHGLEPGDPGDEAIAFVTGTPEQRRYHLGDLRQIAPTIATVLGLPTDGFAMPSWV